MTKYYYDGELIRTSKHDNYAFALIIEYPSGKKVAKTCSASISGASKDYNYYKNRGYNVYLAPITKERILK